MYIQKQDYIYRLIENQILCCPNKTAIIDQTKQVTYAELNVLSNCIANHLLSLGISQNSFIGIYMESSVDAIVSILAILKVGGIYVPLDPTYPAENTKYMIKDSKVTFILTKAKFFTNLKDNVSNKVCNFVDIESVFQKSNNKIINLKIEYNQKLACIIYTSGTTGKPKGVMTTNSNLCNYIKALSQRLSIKNDDIYLHTASIAFSSSNRQIFVPLCNGCTIIMASREEKLNPQLFFELIKFRKVTIVDLVPTYVKNCIGFLEILAGKARDYLITNDLRLVLSASEALNSSIPRRLRKIIGKDIQYINMYGMTETTGIVSTYEIPVDSTEDQYIVPIGKAIDNMELEILDENNEPIHNQNIGHLYIGGSQLTSGYLNKPEQTTKSYVTVTLGERKENMFLFRTGDLCKYNENGDIEYIGRSDHQIKINGMRIEPQEIEMVAQQFSGILESLVITIEKDDITNLVLFYLENSKVDKSKLCDFLKFKLPKQMIPAYFIPLNEFPITPNGKINRLALKEYKLHLDHSKEIIEPRNKMEKDLLDIWKEVFRVESIGINHSLFDFSSNSISLFRILSLVYTHFSINVPISFAYAHPTIAEWSDYIEKNCGIKIEKQDIRKGVL